MPKYKKIFLLFSYKLSFLFVNPKYLKQVADIVFKTSNKNPINKHTAIFINKCSFEFIYNDVTEPTYIQKNENEIMDRIKNGLVKVILYFVKM